MSYPFCRYAYDQKFQTFVFGMSKFPPLIASVVVLVAAGQQQLGDLHNISCGNSQCDVISYTNATLNATTVPLRLQFYGPSTVRWWLAIDGNFSDNVSARSRLEVGAGYVHVKRVHICNSCVN